MANKPLILADNYFDDVVLHPDHVVSNPANDDVAGSEVYNISDHLRDFTRWTPAAPETERVILVDCKTAKTVDTIVLDRGHNLRGRLVYFESSDDGVAFTPAYADNIPYVTGGLPTDARGCVTPDGVWWKSLGALTKRYFRLRFPVGVTLVADPENFGNWTPQSTGTLVGGQADPFGGTQAWLLTDTDVASTYLLRQAVAFTGDGTKSASVFVKKGSADVSEFAIRSTTAGVYRHRVRVDWVNNAPVLSSDIGGGTLYSPENYGNGWWRLSAGVDAVIAAESHLMMVLSTVAPVPTPGSSYFFGAQAENVARPNSYRGPSVSAFAPIVTGAYIGQAYRFPEYLDAPASYDYRSRVQVLKNDLTQRAARVKRGVLRFDEVDLSLRLEEADFQNIRPYVDRLLDNTHPWWFCLDDSTTEGAGLMRLFQLPGDITYDPQVIPVTREIRATLEEVIPSLAL